jgi:hypothetical protein
MPARAALALILAVAAQPAAAAQTSAANQIAQIPSRCNARMLDALQEQIRAYDKQPPEANDQTAVQKRFHDLDGVLRELNEERDVIDNVCTTDAQKIPLEAQAITTAASALVLQSALVPNVATCAPGGVSVQIAMLAQAWLDIATAVKDAGQATPAIANVEHQVQASAQAIGFTLPVFDDTSVYWRNTVTAQARAAAKACPTPMP